MNPPRRWCSEQIGLSALEVPRVVPPHKAAKLRETQLRQQGPDPKDGVRQSHLPVRVNEHIEKTRFDESHGSNRAFKSASQNREADGHRHPSVPKVPAGAPSLSTINQQQLDGAGHFPSIDAIISGADDRDKRRVTAETEFYEHQDPEGVTRRRSIMRTVDKDDLLTARGANPRTGLITPYDAGSLAGSVDSERARRQQRQISSAQWRLEGDQWVSTLPDGKPHPLRVHAKPTRDASTQSAVPAEAAIAGQRKVTPLTESNLQTLTSSPAVETSPKGAATLPNILSNVSKVRRKPVGSPSRVASTVPQPQCVRNDSNETVVRTPSPHHGSTVARPMNEYFSPDDIGRHEVELNGPKIAAPSAMPFLGLPARPRNVRNHRQGFANPRANLEQLQHSLRTNSGPYPLPPSRSYPLLSRGTDSHPGRRFRGQAPETLPYQEGAEQYPQPAPRAYLPDTAIYLDGPTTQSRQPIFRGIEGRTGTRTASHGRQMTQMNRHQGQRRDVCRPTFQRSDVMCMNTNQSTLTFRERANHTEERSHHNTSSRRTTNPGASRTPEKASIAHRGTPTSSAHRGKEVTMLPGPMKRSDQNSYELKPAEDDLEGAARDSTTTTESEHPSSMTGMRTDESDDTDDAENEQGETENHPPGSDIIRTLVKTPPLEMSVKAIKRGRNKKDEPDEIDLRDHTICCPECCVQFDCHEGCLGHPSPAVSVADSETSSLMSMGVFDSSFETSIKAVNTALLEPKDKHYGKLSKLRNALAAIPWSNEGSSPKASTKKEKLERTLRDSPPRRQKMVEKPVRSATTSSRENGQQAKTAATRAMYVETASDNHKTSPRATHTKIKPARPKKTLNASNKDDMQPAPRPDEEWSTRHEATNLVDVAEPKRALELVTDRDESSSVFNKVKSLVRRSSIHWGPLQVDQSLATQVLWALARLREMWLILFDTISNLSVMAFEYKRTGNITIPKHTSIAELAGNCLRSILYLMIAACIWALFARVVRVVFVVLRIVLLPVKLCVWVIG